MIIGDRLRALREEKKLSQGDVEKRTGLLRCYISRVENGHTVPAIETLEKMARSRRTVPRRLNSHCRSWGTLDEGAAACLALADKLLEKDCAILIETLGRALGKTIASDK